MIETNSFVPSARALRNAGLVAVVCAAGACASFNNQEKGGAIGAAAGGAVGAVVGNNTGSTARGAIIGAVVGGVAGAVIGHQMDQQAKELEAVVPEADIERVGEGIQVTFASGLLYGFDSDAIRPEAARNLQSLAASLKEHPETQLLIVGHTDALGATAYNQDLSTRRADAASRYLVSQGIAVSRLQTAGRGELEAVGSNETEAGRQMNRRIEVAIFASEAARTAAR
jgi:outer membrane protein OmpA-like peptidoglycan-associated protein